MITIKGGVTILPKSDNSELMDKLDDSGVKVKMPFEATGFTSTKMPKCVDRTKIVGPKSKVTTQDVVKPTSVKPTKNKVKSKKKSLLNKLKK